MKLLIVVSVCLVLSSCAFQRSKWEEGDMVYSQINITPPFGFQAESAGQMSATVLEDGTWELTIGRTDKGIDNTVQAEALRSTLDVLVLLGKLYAAQGVAK